MPQVNILPPWAFSAFSLELRQRLQYRFDFFTRMVVAIVVRIAVAYSLWASIFEAGGYRELGGYTFEALVLYSLLASLFVQMEQPEMGIISTDIREGSLTRYLLYPVTFLGYKSVMQCAHIAFGMAQLFVGLAVYACFTSGEALHLLTLDGFVMALVAASIASYVWFLMILNVEFFAFWAEFVWSLNITVQFLVTLLGGVFVPLTFYPEWAQILFSWLPFQYFIAFPISVAMGKVGPAEFFSGLGMLFIWACLLMLLARFIWNRGKFRYTGVGI